MCDDLNRVARGRRVVRPRAARGAVVAVLLSAVVAYAATPATPATAPATAPAVLPPEPPLRKKPTVRLAPVPRPPPEGDPRELDARIDLAIRRASDYLLKAFDGSELDLPEAEDDERRRRGPVQGQVDLGISLTAASEGLHALIVYALLSAGRAVDDPRLTPRDRAMAGRINAMKAHTHRGNSFQTYAVSLRAAALSVRHRPEDRDVLRRDVARLVYSATNGRYTYVLPYDTAAAVKQAAVHVGGPRNRWDNSNSQFGVLGVWAAADVGEEVPSSYWQAIGGHWEGRQRRDGGWDYGPQVHSRSSYTMTGAGVATLAVASDFLYALRPASEFADTFAAPSVVAGLEWLAAGDRALTPAGQVNGGYALFTLERAGLATGFRYFGKHDWYRELAADALARQRKDGSWDGETDRALPGRPGTLSETAFTLLFLAKGRHPVMLNKLRYDGRWSNRPRDAANVARFTAGAVERPLGWQVVSSERPGEDWLDAPILYLSGNEPPRLTPKDYDEIRAYVRGGGLVFLHADGGSEAFAKWAADEFVPKVCPAGQALRDLPPSHPLLTTPFRQPPGVRLRAATNGSRVVVVLSPDDLAGVWQARSERTALAKFGLMANVYGYATGGLRLHNRAVPPTVDAPPAAPVAKFPVARVKHAGDWDPEPGAWPRFNRLFQWETGAAVTVAEVPAAGMKDMNRGSAVIAHLTGTAPFEPTEADLAGLRAYVEAGGVLLVEACGGNPAFADWAEQTLIPAALPGVTLEDAWPDRPPLARTQDVTDDLTRRVLRPGTEGKPVGRAVGIRKGRFGRGYVLLSRFDLSTGLLGCNADVTGFAPDYCKGVMKNLVVWSATMRE